LPSSHALTHTLESQAQAGTGDQLTIGELIDDLDEQAIGPALFAPAIIAISPIGAIPGMAIALGAVIILISLQFFKPGGGVWLPGRLRRFSVSRAKFESGVNTVSPWLRRVERVLQPRFTALSKPPATHLIAVISIAMGAAMWPLAVVPFAAGAPAGVVLLFATGLTMRDGAVICGGFAGVLGVGYLLMTTFQ